MIALVDIEKPLRLLIYPESLVSLLAFEIRKVTFVKKKNSIKIKPSIPRKSQVIIKLCLIIDF